MLEFASSPSKKLEFPNKRQSQKHKLEISYIFILLCAFSNCFCHKWLWLDLCSFFAMHILISISWTHLILFPCIKTTLKQYLRCLTKCLHSATISTILKDYHTLLMLQSSPFNVNITNKITTFIGFMRSARRFGHSKEKMDLHASLHHQE